MKLYHSSYLKLSILNPTVGSDRHDGEDPRAVGQPVVYLTAAEDEKMRGKGEDHVATYKYIVEIPEDDPDLFIDEKDFLFIQECNQAFEENDLTRWYFLKRSIAVKQTLEWNGEVYVERENF
ncbi:hypothetical protein CSV72_02270 [Sporosarcina sp. P20a]|uniref:hypothetical protein n=1 Tax=Sporosarcina sp. P20a TaxID=2048256 RepID=UPI000C171C55|nr:hypothetical protein [Sporosarcina sp. P20a]PIC87995.1 hypothetical protein CSV72_02270 [Sporosarcina sp. P20a]